MGIERSIVKVGKNFYIKTETDDKLMFTSMTGHITVRSDLQHTTARELSEKEFEIFKTYIELDKLREHKIPRSRVYLMELLGEQEKLEKLKLQEYISELSDKFEADFVSLFEINEEFVNGIELSSNSTSIKDLSWLCLSFDVGYRDECMSINIYVQFSNEIEMCVETCGPELSEILYSGEDNEREFFNKLFFTKRADLNALFIKYVDIIKTDKAKADENNKR